MGMTPKAISLPAMFQLPAESAIFSCDGTYDFSTERGAAEIEVINTLTLWRSVIYLHRDRALSLFLPPAPYRFLVRSMDGDGQPHVLVRRLGSLQKLRFYLGKALHLLRRPPHESLARAVGFFRRKHAKMPVAAQTGGAVEADRLPVVARNAFYPAPVDRPRQAVSIIIPTKERFDLLSACIDSLRLIKGSVYEIIIVDNGATHPKMLDYLAELERSATARVLHRDVPFNFSYLCNEGARLARHPLLLFLNDDIEAMDGEWLSAMQGFAARDDTGVVGARLLYPSGALQHGGIASHLVPGPGHPWRGVPKEIWQSHPLLAQAGEVDAVTGACLMIGHDLFDAIGGFDEHNFAVTLNDVDLCLRVRERGLKVVYAPQATLLHKEGQTRRADDRPEESVRYTRELAAYFRRHESAARTSVFYPLHARRDTDSGF